MTTNGGATWALQARDDAVPLPKVGTPPSGEAGFLSAGDGEFWVAVTRSTLYASEDGGLDWHTVGVTTQAEGGSGSIDFLGKDGWCLYHGLGLWHTTDGGKIWREMGASGVIGDSARNAQDRATAVIPSSLS